MLVHLIKDVCEICFGKSKHFERRETHDLWSSVFNLFSSRCNRLMKNVHFWNEKKVVSWQKYNLLLNKLLYLLKNFQFCFEISLDLLKNSIFFKVQIFFRNKVHWSIKIINRLLWKILLVTRKWYNYCWSRVIYLYWILSRVSYT